MGAAAASASECLDVAAAGGGSGRRAARRRGQQVPRRAALLAAVAAGSAARRPQRAWVGPLVPGRFGAQAPPPCRWRVRARAGPAETDPWGVLGVAPGATAAEIKKAYRKKALKEHPDVNKAPDAKEKWQVLSSAYDILSDPEKFKKWEASGRGGGGRPGPGESSRGGSSESARRQQQRWEEQRAWEARRARQQAGRGGAQDSDLSAAAFAVGKAAAVAAGIAGAAVGAAGKAVQAAAGPGVAGQGITGLAGAAGRAVGFAGAAGKSVLDSVSPRASRIAKMKLDELLEFIGQAPTPPAGAPRAAASGDLRAEEAEAERLQARVDSLRRDQDSWEEQARALNSSGDRRGELEALRRALQAKDAGRAARAELFACYDRIDAARGAPRP